MARKDKSNDLYDVQDALDHIVAIGSRIRHDNWRYTTWVSQEQYPGIDRSGEVKRLGSTASENTSSTGNVPQGRKQIHAEDFRIYNMAPWPDGRPAKRRRRSDTLNGIDSEWNAEHGDTINPLAFSISRLSQHTSTPCECCTKNHVHSPAACIHVAKTIGGDSCSTGNQNFDVLENQVPHALVLRCWDRAVHASSGAIFSNVKEKLSSFTMGSQEDSIGSAPTDTCEYSSASAKTKCDEWNLKLHPVEPFQCIRCKIEFETLAQLQRHFYGDDRFKQRGCCWELIHFQQRSAIGKVLQTHVQSQVDGLLQAIMDNAQEKLTGVETNRLINWQDVMQILQMSLDASKSRTTPTLYDEESNGESSGNFPENTAPNETISPGHPVLETLEIADCKSPLVLNGFIMLAVKKRLVDRYADVPF